MIASLDFLPWILSFLRGWLKKMLFVSQASVPLTVDDVISSHFVGIVSFRCNTIDLTRFIDMITLNILLVEIVLDHIAILVAALALRLMRVVHFDGRGVVD